MNLPKLMATALLKLMGWKIQQDIPEVPQKCVAIGAPHVNWQDALVGIGGAVLLRLKMKFLLKSDFFRFPFTGFFKALGGIPVNRGKSGKKDRKKLVEEIVQKLEQEEQFVLVITPEGTRKKVTKWKKGFYRIALAAKVPIVLCYMDHVNKIGGVGKLIHPTGDMDKDLRAIMAFYANVPQKYPNRFSIDLEYQPEKQKIN